MAKRLSNQEIERLYFEKFQTVYPLPAGTIRYGDKPDIIINGPKIIGIEVTRFYTESGSALSSEQRQKPLRECVVAKAQQLFKAGGGNDMELVIGFDPTNPITTARLNILPQEIADFAIRLNSRDADKSLKLQDTSPEVEFVYFTGEYPDPHWTVSQVYSLKHMSLVELENIVRGKEAKSNDYKSCDMHWLLVIVDSADRAQEQEIRVENIQIQSNVFQKVIVFNPWLNHVVEINSGH